MYDLYCFMRSLSLVRTKLNPSTFIVHKFKQRRPLKHRVISIGKQRRNDVFTSSNQYLKYVTLSTFLLPTDEKIHVCDICGKAFKTKLSLYLHIKRHIGKNSICEICGKGFISPYWLKRHHREEHEGRCTHV